jgi:hypothetical protein
MANIVIKDLERNEALDKSAMQILTGGLSVAPGWGPWGWGPMPGYGPMPGWGLGPIPGWGWDPFPGWGWGPMPGWGWGPQGGDGGM